MFDLKRFTLQNGVRVLVVSQNQSPSTTIAVLVQAGTAYENRSTNGISHFLEHMCFKGTKKRPRPIDISSEFERMGADYNAFTSRDLTGYYAKVAWPNTQRAFDLISDMYLNPLFQEEEIEKEKGVVIEEINMYEDDPRSKVEEIIERLMYGDQPAGFSITGPKENIRKISRADIIRYRLSHYIGPKTIVVIAGNISEKEARDLAQRYFGSIKKGRRIIKPEPIVDNQKRPAVTTFFKDLDQSHLILAFKTFSVHSEDRFVLSILSSILGGGLSSRLFQKVREELGAAYYVGSSTNLFSTHGYLDIFAGVNHSKVFDAIQAIIAELKDITKNGVTQEELERTKEYISGNFLLSLETPFSLALYYAEQEAQGLEIISPDQVVEKIKSITKDQVARLARQVISNSKLNFAIVGPWKSSKDFRSLVHL
jgi:predicted Zn-dependent peptidase